MTNFHSIQTDTNTNESDRERENHFSHPILQRSRLTPPREPSQYLRCLPECTPSIPPPVWAVCPLPFPHEALPSLTPSQTLPPQCVNRDSHPRSRMTSQKLSPIPTTNITSAPPYPLPAAVPTLPISLAAGPNPSQQPPVLAP